MTAKTAATSARPADPCCLVIFGASGDLTHRLLVPALYNLAVEGLLPEAFALVGVARSPFSNEAFAADLAKSLPKFATRDVDERAVKRVLGCVAYVQGDPDDDERHGAPEHVTAPPAADQPPGRLGGVRVGHRAAACRHPAPPGSLASQLPGGRRGSRASLAALGALAARLAVRAAHREQAPGHVAAIAHLGERAQLVLEPPERVRLYPAGAAGRDVGVRPVKFRAAELAVDEGGQQVS